MQIFGERRNSQLAEGLSLEDMDVGLVSRFGLAVRR